MTQAAAPLEAVRTCQQLMTRSDGARRYCSQSVAVTHWFDTTGHEHAACSRHVASMKSRWVPEPAVPGVFVSEAEARELWDDCAGHVPGCPGSMGGDHIIDHPADATVESEYATYWTQGAATR